MQQTDGGGRRTTHDWCSVVGRTAAVKALKWIHTWTVAVSNPTTKTTYPKHALQFFSYIAQYEFVNGNRSSTFDFFVCARAGINW